MNSDSCPKHTLVSHVAVFHPYSQILQEYPEMKELQEESNKLAEIRGEEKIQMAVRVGKADPAYYPYRRSFNSFSR